MVGTIGQDLAKDVFQAPGADEVVPSSFRSDCAGLGSCNSLQSKRRVELLSGVERCLNFIGAGVVKVL